MSQPPRRDLDEADTALDEATGEEAALAEGFAAVGGAQFAGFLGEVEGLEVLGLHHGDGVVIHVGVGLHVAVREGGAELLVEFVGKLHAGLELVLGETLAGSTFLRPFSGLLTKSGAVRGREETGTGMAAVVADEDEVRQGAVAAALEHIEPGAHRGMADGAAQLVAGVHDVVALLVRALGGGERVDDRGVVHLLRRERQVFGDADAVGAGLDGLGRAGGLDAFLRIPGVHVASGRRSCRGR